MKNGERLFSLVISSLILFGCASTRTFEGGAAAPSFTLDELLSRMPPKDSLEARWIFSSMIGMGQQCVLETCKKLGPPGSDNNARAESALQGVAMYVVCQGREPERLMFVSALSKALESPMPVKSASFLIARLQVAGKAESVPVLSRFLTVEELCEPAAQALVAIRDGASDPLLAALQGAGAGNRVTIIKSLGDLRYRGAVEQLLKEAGSKDSRVRRSALSALANIGDRRADEVLSTAVTSGPESERNSAIWDRILFARRLAEAGDTTIAFNICKDLYNRKPPTESYIRSAALEVMVRTRGEGVLDDLLAAMDDPDKSLRADVLGLVIPGEAATARWCTVMKRANPEVRSEILAMLGQRGDKSAYPEVVRAFVDPDSLSRISAIEAAFRLKGAESVSALLGLLERSKQPGDIAAIRRCLRQLPANAFVRELTEALPRLTTPSVAALIELLSDYGPIAPSAPLIVFTKHDDASVRLAAVKALGLIATEGDQSHLIELVLSSKNDQEQSAAQKSLASVCGRVADPERRAEQILGAMNNAPPAQQAVLLRSLGRVGGKKALSTAAECAQSKDANLREAAIRALADWPTIDAYEDLLTIAKGKDKLNLRVLALRGCVRVVENAPINAPTAVRYHERTLATAERMEEKRLVLGALGSLRTMAALKLVVPYLGDDSLGLDAAVAASKVASGVAENKDDQGSAEVTRTFIESRVVLRYRSQVAAAFDAKTRMNEPPEGFTALFNGKDLTGWKGLVENPPLRESMDPARLAAAQLRADSSMRAHWSVSGGVLLFDGKGENLCTSKDYGDFELLVDWKIGKNGDSGIYLRGSPQVQIWDPAYWPEGSGGLYNNEKNPNKPLLKADNPIGEWNTFRIRMIGDRVTVYLNEVLVVDSVVLENYWNRSIPIFPVGQIELQSHNSPLYFRNIFVKEIPRRNPFLSGTLFNGVDLTGWQIIEGKEGSWGVKDGILYTTGEGGGWLSTAREYSDFQLDLDVRVSEAGNSGVFLRSPRQGDPAYTGMEIQVLDDYAPEYANLKPWQYCGSIYGVHAASPRATRKANEWQHMQIVADGPHVTVTLNNQVIVDADLISHMDKEANHPGLKRRAGFIGLQCHTSKVEYRNITLKELR